MKALNKHLTKIFTVVTAALMLTSTAAVKEIAPSEARTNTEQGATALFTSRASSLLSAAPTETIEVQISTAQQLFEHLGRGEDSTYYTYVNTQNKKPNYVITADLDFTSFSYTAGGSAQGYFKPVDVFFGTIKGQGNVAKTIKGLKIDATSANPPSNSGLDQPYSRQTAPAGLVQVLAQNSEISYIKFDGCEVKGQDTVGTAAGVSYGTISNVTVTSGDIRVTGNPVAVGGLVGEYYTYVDTQNISTDIKGTIKNGTFSGVITDGSQRALSNTSAVGGLIGANKSGSGDTAALPADADSLHWDISSTNKAAFGTNYIANPIGQNGSTLTGAKGYRVLEGYRGTDSEEVKKAKYLVLPDPDGLGVTVDRVSVTSVLEVVPDVGLTDSNWSSEGTSVSRSGSEFIAQSVGTTTFTYTITVNNVPMTFSCELTVVAYKDSLDALIARAKTEYPDDHSSNYSETPQGESDTAWNLYKAKLQAAEQVSGNILSDDNTVRNTITELDAEIDRLIEIDKRRLQDKCNNTYAPYLAGEFAGYYDEDSYNTFKSNHANALRISQDANTISSAIYTAEKNLDDSFNALKLKLGTITAERNAENTEVTVTVNGYVKRDESIAGGATATVKTSKQKEFTDVVTTTSEGVTTFKLAKAQLGEEFNLGTTLTVVITSGGKESAEAEVVLAKRPNEVKGDVDVGTIGTIDMTGVEDLIKNKAVTGIPVIYDPQTGTDDAKVNGNVEKWDLNNTEYPGQTWSTTGTKMISGIIADTNDYTNPNKFYVARGIVEIVDKSSLQKALNNARAYSESGWTTDTWTDFNAKRTKATEINNSTTSTQQEIDDATKELEDAMAALKSQPEITFQRNPVNLGIGSVFEPKLYCKATDKADTDEVAFANIVVTVGEGEDKIVLYEAGKAVNMLDTSKAGKYEVTYSVTNSQGVTGTAVLTVNIAEGLPVVTATPTTAGNGTGGTGGSGGTGGNNGTGSGSGGTTSGNIVSGNNTVTDGTIIIEFQGTDLFTEEEIKNGVKLVLEVKTITDQTNIKAVLEKLKSLLTGEVTIDGIYDIVLYKEINGQRTKISNSDIKNAISVYLPISQKAIDSKDYACIHVLSNGGYDLLTGTISNKDNKQYMLVKTKSFSEFAVVYGGGISKAATSLDTTNTTANSGTGAGTGSGAGQGGGNATNQGGGDTTTTTLVRTGDTSIIIAVAVTAAISAVACGVILIKKRKYSK